MENLLAHGRTKGYKKLLGGEGSTVQVSKVPMQNQYEEALENEAALDKKFKLVDLNEHANEDLILSINISFSIEKKAFGLVCNAKSFEFPMGDCILAWNKLVNKFALHAASSLLKFKSEFHNSKLDLRKIPMNGS